MKVLVGSAANNTHIHQIGQALEESGALSRFVVPFAGFSMGMGRLFPSRQPIGIPPAKIGQKPLWEVLRVAAAKVGMPSSWVDLLWEHQEHAFDRACARIVAVERPDVFIGVEHGSLAALREARDDGVVGGLIFTSLHHKFRERWLEPELKRFPLLLDKEALQIRARDRARDERRDEEIKTADFLHANSLTTARSLEDAGVRPNRIITVPLGAPPAVRNDELRTEPPTRPVVLFVGNVAIHKGAHHLLDAWKMLGSRAGGASLELYGTWALPAELHPAVGSGVIEFGRVPHDVVRAAMRRASVLVLPSICVGFGMVVAEAMAQGLPVICSRNAGASQLVVEGKNGFVVPPADPGYLAERLAWCLDRPFELQAMGREALETARNWTWADFRKRFSMELFIMIGRINSGAADSVRGEHAE